MKNWLLILFMLIGSISYAGSVPTFYGPMKKANMGNASISYFRFGHGKPLLLMTGHGDTMMMWHPAFLKQLSKNHEIIMFDYPGIGKSSIQGAYPNRMEQLSSLIRSFMKAQKLHKPDMLGFSMGGSLLLYMTANNGVDFDHVIVVGAKAGGKKTVTPDPKYFNMLSDPSISPDVAVKTLLFPADAAKQADAYLKIVSGLPQEKMDGAALKAQAEAVTDENTGPGIWDQLPGIKNKVMVLSGTDDVLAPVQNAVLITEAIPGAWLVRIQGAGHGILFQDPEYMSEIIELFLKS
ncbi:2-succinyl-6-hydroxy-2, 4-cyclohexadiene-1-carboxylate synthase [Aquicella siphonis]|uniref:2-succinyl-6-hydroxy-2, 4-cyclohexadiene-1-carboxylate synthase n=1 Tax=Aquicella siphonis TaxID=254247 RepID=A0A5E4PFH6_9COXI|nr:alpha/beta hydrolase [Aquicella siphonis]VVC75739.1 2-succinyl-6-hydroxy-2, 4-cyclohexadiene-1-carboxylate synthase [Aquicella siphonis]